MINFMNFTCHNEINKVILGPKLDMFINLCNRIRARQQTPSFFVFVKSLSPLDIQAIKNVKLINCHFV